MNDRPIFVVGAPRSGTTMLQLMLHAHARIAIPPETRFLLPAYERRRDWGDLQQIGNRRRLAAFITSGTMFQDLGLDRDAICAEIVAGPPTLGSAFGIVYRAYSRRFDKPRWGDKRPAYLPHLGTIAGLFPDAQVVHIVRDGRDCVASMREAPWHHGGINQAIANWNRGMDAGSSAAKVLGPSSYVEISYERLVSDPEPELRALCAYLGEEYDASMATPNELADAVVPGRKSWHALTHQRPTPTRIGTWKHRLTPSEVGICEALMGRRLRERGYYVSGHFPVSVSDRFAYAPLGARARLGSARQALLDRYHHVRPERGIAAMLPT